MKKNYNVQYKFFLKKFIIFKLYRKVYDAFFFFSKYRVCYLFVSCDLQNICFFIVDACFGFVDGFSLYSYLKGEGKLLLQQLLNGFCKIMVSVWWWQPVYEFIQ